MKHFYLAVLSVAVLAACGDSGQPLALSTEAPPAARLSAQASATNEFIPFLVLSFVPCANGGAGEEVLVEGTLHQVVHLTPSASHLTIHQNTQGLTGTGLTSGDTYHSMGSSNFHLNLGSGSTQTFTSSFLLIGPGPDNNFRVHQMFHFIVNANGELTSEVDSTSVTCS